MAQRPGIRGPPGLVRQKTVYVTGAATEPIENYYTLHRGTLGKPGNYGVAKKATRKSDGTVFACKIVNKAKFHHVGALHRIWEDMRNEIMILKDLQHPNIVQFEDVFEDKFNLYIIMEFCSGGELFDRVTKAHDRHLSENEAAAIMEQIFLGLEHLHDRGIVHCDLKPDNFLFDSPADDATLKIIDFGMSKRLPRLQKLDMLCGTPYYTAPEIVDKCFTHSADMWSVGVVMFVMVFGYPPFYVDPALYGRREHEMIYKKIKKGFANVTKRGYGSHFPQDIPASDSCKDLIALLLQPNPGDRPTAREALDHPWIRERHENQAALSRNIVSAIKKFKDDSDFKIIVCDVFRTKLRPDQLSAIQATFEQIDDNGDGKISKQEFMTALSDNIGGQNGLNQEEMNQLFDSIDIDQDGFICYQELLTAATHEHLRAQDERLYDAFCELDIDGDGFITPDELMQALQDKNLTDDKVQQSREYVDSVDLNADGKIDYQEFLQALHPDINTDEEMPTMYDAHAPLPGIYGIEETTAVPMEGGAPAQTTEAP